MAWTFLIAAGALEVAATTAFRFSGGLSPSRLGFTLTFFALAGLSLYCLNRSLEGVPLGTAYAVWTGIGAAGTAVLGVWAFGEVATPQRIMLLFALVACIVGLKFVSA
ncbi:Guanidinium exporter [Hyphomicrobium sp. 1Nfss2.1]|uniref:DMT family transporter n=1 Tax=Hyphomicrobium sp. 1Nfss2.1 TaxID=3413936 RepID=UPI003C7C995B